MKISKKLIITSAALVILVAVYFLLPGNMSGKALSSSILIPNTTGCSSGQTRAIGYYDITWTFSGCVPYGTFANGEPWVVGPVTVTSISPGPYTIPSYVYNGKTYGPYDVNGSMINPVPAQTQGFSEYVQPVASSVMSPSLYYSKSKNAALSLPNLVLQPNDVLASSKHGGWPASQGGQQFIESISALTVLPAVPAEGSFRPSIYGTDRTIRWNVSQINWDVLKNLDPVPGTPSTAWIYSEMPSLPWVEWDVSWDGWYMQPQKNTADGSLRGDPIGKSAVYGRDTSYKFGEVGLWLNTNQNVNDKKAIAIKMIQNGIDIYSYLQFSGAGFLEDGGHKAGRKLPVVIAAAMLNDGNQLLESKASNPTIFQEDRQIWFVSQNDVGRLVQDPVKEGKCYPSVPKNQEDLWCGREFLTYTQIDADTHLPEWGIRHSRNPYEDNKSWSATYRHTVFPAMIGPILVAELMGLKSAWNHPPEFAYLERHYNISNGIPSMPFFNNMYITYKMGTASTDATLNVTKTGNGTVTGTGINCGTDCSETYTIANNTQVTLTATPSVLGSTISWSGGGCSGNGTTCGPLLMTSSKNVTVSITAPVIPWQIGTRVMVTHGSSDSINVRGTAALSGTLLGTQANGNTGTVIGGPVVEGAITWWNINYDQAGTAVISGWNGDGWSGQDNITATGTTTPGTTYTLSTTTDGSGPGTVSGAGTYASGSTVHVMATPGINSVFLNWSGDCSGSTNPCVLNMNSSKSVTATFTPSGPVCKPWD